MFRKWAALLCECGCGEQVSKLGNRYIRGHSSRVRSEETIRKIGAAAKGRVLTEEHKRKVRIGVKLAYENDPGYAESISRALKGRIPSQEERKTKSIVLIGQYAYDRLSNYEWMFEQLITKDKSPTLAAKELGVSYDTIRSWSQKLGIKYRNHGKDWLEDPVMLASIGKRVRKFLKGRKYSEERKESMSITGLEPNGRQKYDCLSNYEYMYEQLITRDKSISQVARELDVSEATIRKWARKFKIRYHNHSNTWQTDSEKLIQATLKQSQSMKRSLTCPRLPSLPLVVVISRT